MRRLDGITDSVDMSCSKLWEMVMGRGSWGATVTGSQRAGYSLATEQQWCTCYLPSQRCLMRQEPRYCQRVPGVGGGGQREPLVLVTAEAARSICGRQSQRQTGPGGGDQMTPSESGRGKGGCSTTRAYSTFISGPSRKRPTCLFFFKKNDHRFL